VRLDVYSHHVKVSEIEEKDRDVLFQFCRPLIQHSLVRVARGKFVNAPVKTFAAATKDRKEFRFHINQLDDLKLMLRNYGHGEDKLTVVEHRLSKDDFPTVEFEPKTMPPPRDYQVDIVNYVMEEDKYAEGETFPSKIVTLQTGRGKAVSLDTLVRVPGGWKQMRELKVGDKVISRDGSATTITGYYPQEPMQLYWVTFEDGRRVEVCGEHLWQCFYSNTTENDRWKVRNTLEMKRLIEAPQPWVYIPLPQPEEMKVEDHLVDPYLLGVIIGDGVITQNEIIISTQDKEIVDEVNRRSYDYALCDESKGSVNRVMNELHRLNLHGCHSHEKFIPKEYLEHGSVEQRFALLQGLMDTGGYIAPDGTTSYDTNSKQLAEDVQYLVRSLGGIAKISTEFPKHAHKGEKSEGRLAYRVWIRHPKPSRLVRIQRRVNDENQCAETLKLRVKSIEPSRVADSACIAVDHPEKLYVVQDFIVTHNTFVAILCMLRLKLRTVFIFKGGYADRWVGDLEEKIHFKKGELLVVRGAGGLTRVMEMALEGELTAKALIITYGTMRDYLKDYEQFNGNSEIYPIAPQDFYQKMGIGFRVIDEVHQEFHLNFRQDLYTHTYKSLSLSATMESSDQFMNKVYDIAYPIRRRNDGGGYIAFISVKAVLYRFEDPRTIRFKGGTGGYSHNELEKSVMKQKDKYANYKKMIAFMVERFYGSVREDGQKMLVFCASVEMCTHVAQMLQSIYPTLKVARYCQDDDYKDLLEADIGVSTILSAGTAVDIPNLRVTLMTTAIDSRQSNEQTLGRTRMLRDWPDVTPEFIYLVCEDIEQHVKYHWNKVGFFRGKVIGHSTVNYPYKV